jgi:diacylglycerol kinase family enzyme
MAGSLPSRRAGQCCSSTRGRVTATPRARVAEQAREKEIEAVILAPGQDLDALAGEAVAAGADALGMAGGDGSLAVVAAVAAAHGIPFVCVRPGRATTLRSTWGWTGTT